MSDFIKIDKYSDCDSIHTSYEGKNVIVLDIQSSKNSDIPTEYTIPCNHNSTILIVPYLLDNQGLITKIGVIHKFFPNRNIKKSYTVYSEELGNSYLEEYDFCIKSLKNKFNIDWLSDRDWTYISNMYSSNNSLQEYSLWSLNCTFHLEELSNTTSPFEFFSIGEILSFGDMLIASSYLYIWKYFYDNYLNKNENTL